MEFVIVSGKFGSIDTLTLRVEQRVQLCVVGRANPQCHFPNQ